MDGSTLILIGAGLLITGCCAGAWINFTADGADHESIGRLATIGTEPRAMGIAHNPPWVGAADCVGAADNGGTDAFSEHEFEGAKGGSLAAPVVITCRGRPFNLH